MKWRPQQRRVLNFWQTLTITPEHAKNDCSHGEILTSQICLLSLFVKITFDGLWWVGNKILLKLCMKESVIARDKMVVIAAVLAPLNNNVTNDCDQNHSENEYRVKPVSSGHSKLGKTKVLKTSDSLMQVKSSAPALGDYRYWKHIFGSLWSFLFVWFDSLRPLNNLSVMRDGSSWV